MDESVMQHEERMKKSFLTIRDDLGSPVSLPIFWSD